MEDLEVDIAAAEEEVQLLEEALANPDLYRDGDKVKQTTKAFEEAKAYIARLYEHWEEALELRLRNGTRMTRIQRMTADQYG